MLSVCGSIYMNNNLLTFVQSILEQSSDPDGIEFVVVEDEAGSDLMAACFDQVRILTKNLKIIPVSKQERIDYFERCIAFYEREAIYLQERIVELRKRLALYASGGIRYLWFTPMRNYNIAISGSSGDVILNTPLDLKIHFDVSDLYMKFKAALASKKNLLVHFGLTGGNLVRQHGLRMFDRALFDAIKKKDEKFSPDEFGFDERWFLRCIAEDEWNRRAENSGARARGWEELFGERKLFSMVKARSPDLWWAPVYLNEEKDYDYFIGCTRTYERARGYKL